MSNETRPPMIAIEGIDGAGTTTQAHLLVEWLQARGVGAHETREPTSGPTGLLIRRALGGALQLGPAPLALLFAADRIEHVEQEVAEQQRAGRLVVTDRYVYSSLAYQSVELDLDWVAAINARAPEPDLTVYLRVDPELALGRVERRGGPREIYENLERQRRVAALYDRLLGTCETPAHWHRAPDGRWLAPAAAGDFALPGGPAGRRAAVGILDGAADVQTVQASLRALVAEVARQRGIWKAAAHDVE